MPRARSATAPSSASRVAAAAADAVAASHMHDLIPLINKLQDILSAIGNSPLDLPQIAVVGSQSSGKSSVLEAIVGKDFLPKGNGIVTRRPLVLQLRNVPPHAVPEGEEPVDVAEFSHCPDRVFTDFADVRREIEAETARIAGDNKGIATDPIRLCVRSPNVVDLTLVDLPGLTKIPVGDQPSDIELQIRELIMGFITKPNCLILAVSPANVDLANSDSLKLAREVDPTGDRTLGLLTKVDLMEPGTHALDILAGRVYPLRLGFVGVVNRSQRDIDQGKSLEFARKREQQFFATHPVYSPVASRCGTTVLARTLNQVLLAHIRDRLPDLKAKLNALINAKQAELVALGGGETAHSGQSPASTVLRLITKYAAEFQASVEGTVPASATTSLSGGARLFQVFDQGFGNALDAVDPMATLTVREIRTAIRNATGARAALFFVPEAAFDLLVKPQIARLEEPALRCVDQVYEELLRLTHECGSAELRRYPILRARVVDAVAQLLKEYWTPARQFVATLVAIQRAYINTAHPDFIGGAQAVAVLERKMERERRKHADRMRRVASQPAAPHHVVDPNVGAAALAVPNGTGTLPSAASGPASITGLLSAMSLRRGASSVAGDDGSGSPLPSPRALPAAPAPALAATSPPPAAAVPRTKPDGFLTYMFGAQDRPPSIYGGPKMGGMGLGMAAAAASTAGPSMSRSPSATRAVVPQPPMPAVPQVTFGSNGELGVDSDGGLAPAARSGAAADNDEFTIALIRMLITSYFGVVRKTLADTVPKAVMHLLVNETKEALQNRLVQALYRDELVEGLLAEDPEVVAQREECRALLEVYQQALEVIAQAY
ncbi:Dynamin- GTPase protein [Allomyces arbusculus]|nr:Dynamin- GTPase protein [Allomyces arbusculus]